MNNIDHLSYSSVDLYLSCPEAWRRKYIAKEPTKAGPALVFGSAFHGTVEELVRDRKFDKTAEIWMEQWRKAIIGNVEWGLDTPEAHCNEGLRMLGHKMVQEAIAGIQAKKDEAGYMIERKVELRVPGVNIPIIGYIDIVLEDGTPVDIKTSSRSWADDKASGGMQSLFYLAAMNQMKWPVNWKFTHMIFVKTKEPKVQVIQHAHKPAELFFLFELVKRVWDAIEKEAFPINPTGWKCCEAYCDFWDNCRGRYLK